MTNQCRSLYVHVPFCLGKCPYCDFYSVAYSEEAADCYTAAVCRALEQIPFPAGPFETVYFGGGTPSLLGGRRIGAILQKAACFSILPDAEITVECNPCSLTEKNLKEMYSFGVNRISMGIQSASNQQLQLLGRRHDIAQAAKAAAMAQAAGFSHLSFDLMLGLPGQDEPEILKGVQFCREHGAEHVSAYLLKIEPGTVFAKKGMASRCPEEDAQADLYLFAVQTLEAYGYAQYEISNFACNERVSRHNLKYWDCASYLGIGPSAHSFAQGRRFHFPRDLKGFLAAENVWELCQDDGPGGGMEEYIMLRLRLSEGVLWEPLEKRYPGQNLKQKILHAAEMLQGSGLVDRNQKQIRLTPQGMLVSNSIISMLMPEYQEETES